jgi:hypothetical protein
LVLPQLATVTTHATEISLLAVVVLVETMEYSVAVAVLMVAVQQIIMEYLVVVLVPQQ